MLKLQRAEQLLTEFNSAVSLFANDHPPAVREIENPPRRLVPRYSYRLSLKTPPPDWDAPIIVGDILFNLRSALDHFAVALASQRKSVTFPITTFDIDERDETGKYVHGDARRSFRNFVNGIPHDAVEGIKSTQPYNDQRGANPDAHPLAILRHLQNADKHRGLLVVVASLSQPCAQVQGEHYPLADHRLSGDSLIHSSKDRCEVVVSGKFDVRIGADPARTYDMNELVPEITSYVRANVLDRLERFIGPD